MKNYETVEIELDIDIIAELAIMAHNKDIKFNDLIVEILEEFVEMNK